MRFNPAFSLPLSIYWIIILNDIGMFAGKFGEIRGKKRLYQSITVPLYIFLFLSAFQTTLEQSRGERQLLAKADGLVEIMP